MLTMQEDALVKAFSKLVPFSEVNTLSRLLIGGGSEEEKTGKDADEGEYSPEIQAKGSEHAEGSKDV